MPSKYVPAIFQPTIRPSWSGVLSYLPVEEKCSILDALFKYPNQDCNSKFWKETIKPDLDTQYRKFTLSCQAKGRASSTYWEKKGEDMLSSSITDGKVCKDKDKDKGKDKGKGKLSEKDIFDWRTLFLYWEQNKSGGKYKTPESRERMLNRLKDLTKNDFEFAKVVILDAIDHKWQGFCNGNELYFKGVYTLKPKQYKAPDSFIENEDDNHKKVWYDTATRKWHYEIPLINPDWSKWDGTNYLG